jgi:hypothetical protein
MSCSPVSASHEDMGCTSRTCFSACREGRGCTQRTCFLSSRADRGCTLRSCLSDCREGRGCTSRTCFSACRGGRGCTPRSWLSACREGRGCTAHSAFSACRAGKGCISHSRTSPCRGGRGCTARSGFSPSCASIVSFPFFARQETERARASAATANVVVGVVVFFRPLTISDYRKCKNPVGSFVATDRRPTPVPSQLLTRPRRKSAPLAFQTHTLWSSSTPPRSRCEPIGARRARQRRAPRHINIWSVVSSNARRCRH